MMRSGNPTLTADVFRNAPLSTTSSATMTVNGTAVKTLILLGLCVGSASVAWGMVWSGLRGGQFSPLLIPLALGGVFGGAIFGFATSWFPRWSMVTAPLYALAEGVVLGAISAMLEAKFPGIAIQGVSATFGTMFTLLLAYQTRLIRATENFKLGVVAATGGICLVYLASIILGFFGIQIPYIHESGWIGIGFSVFVVVIAALNLVLDFDFIENAAEAGAPKYMEWYGAFGLMATLVWLYIEILRLLVKLNSSRD